VADPIAPNTLIRILKGEGLDVKTYKSSWATHERDDETGKTFGPVHGVMIHHTAGLGVGNYVWSGSAALPGPLAHAYIDKRGTVWLMSAGRANHAGGGDPAVLEAVTEESYGATPPKPRYGEGAKGAADGNDAFYGFECENKGDGKDPWPIAQYTAMVRSSAAICRFYEWTQKSVIGHLEWSNQKVDPKGFPMPQFRDDVLDCLKQKPGAWPSKATKPPAELTVEQRLERLEEKLGLA
jgi:hypothetical protein